MDIVILGIDQGDGSDVAGITGEVCGVVGGAEGATSGIGSTGAAWAGATLMSVGISTGCGSPGCYGCSGPTRAPWSAL